MDNNECFVNMTLTLQAHEEFAEFYNEHPELYENEKIAEFADIYDDLVFNLLINQVNTLNQQLYIEIKRREALLEQLNEARVFIDSVMDEVKKAMQEEETKKEQEKKVSNSKFKDVIRKLLKL